MLRLLFLDFYLFGLGCCWVLDGVEGRYLWILTGVIGVVCYGLEFWYG